MQLAGSTGAKSALLINDRAVSTDQDRKFVFVVGKDNKAEYRPVTLGPAIDGLRVVRDGLKPGEKIVVNGLQRVHPGAPITPDRGGDGCRSAGRQRAETEAKKDEKVAVVTTKSGTSKE